MTLPKRGARLPLSWLGDDSLSWLNRFVYVFLALKENIAVAWAHTSQVYNQFAKAMGRV